MIGRVSFPVHNADVSNAGVPVGMFTGLETKCSFGDEGQE